MKYIIVATCRFGAGYGHTKRKTTFEFHIMSNYIWEKIIYANVYFITMDVIIPLFRPVELIESISIYLIFELADVHYKTFQCIKVWKDVSSVILVLKESAFPEGSHTIYVHRYHHRHRVVGGGNRERIDKPFKSVSGAAFSGALLSVN